jgi:2'-5' RNA ligase
VALQYATATATGGDCFLFVCEVALGKCWSTRVDRPDLEHAPYGYDSVRAVGQREDGQSQFQDEEFVVYRLQQQRLLAVVHLRDSAAPAATATTTIRAPAAPLRPGVPRAPPKWREPLSHLTALVLLPDEALSERIQAIRRVHDPSHVNVWPAHITLLYPFVDPADLPAAMAHLSTFRPEGTPLQVQLQGVGSFDQHKRGFLHYLRIAAPAALQEMLRSLRQHLGPAFHSRKADALHLTIGRRNKVAVAPGGACDAAL